MRGNVAAAWRGQRVPFGPQTKQPSTPAALPPLPLLPHAVQLLPAHLSAVSRSFPSSPESAKWPAAMFVLSRTSVSLLFLSARTWQGRWFGGQRGVASIVSACWMDCACTVQRQSVLQRCIAGFNSMQHQPMQAADATAHASP